MSINEALIDGVAAKNNAASTPSLDVRQWTAADYDADIPPRGWVLGNWICRGIVTALIGEGGVGKTALMYAWALSILTGQKLTGDHIFEAGNVLILSFEDDDDEFRRRVKAAMLRHNIKHADLKGKLLWDTPIGMKLATINKEGMPNTGKLEALIRDEITKNDIDVIFAEPFIKLHEMGENDNRAIDFVMTLLTKIADDLNVAVVTGHHTRKGSAAGGDSEAGRGAGSMKDAARINGTLTRMTLDEAKTFNITNNAERRLLVRLDSGKINLTPPADTATWFKIVGVPLDNPDAAHPNGDNVQTVETWIPPSAIGDVAVDVINMILNDIDVGLPESEGGGLYSDKPAAERRAAWKVVTRHLPEKSQAQAQEMIKTWVKNGVLCPSPYHDAKSRKETTGLKVNPAKRPTEDQNEVPF